MQPGSSFLHVVDHFEMLLNEAPPSVKTLHAKLRHVRQETAFVGREFVVYEATPSGSPRVLTRLTVTDYRVDPDFGAQAWLQATDGTQIEVDYRPARLLAFPVLIYLPLHSKVRWDLREGESVDGGSLAFPVVLRTQSRFSLRERGVVYIETALSFEREFGTYSEA